MAMPIDRVTAGAVVRLTSTPIRRRPRSDQQVQLGARVGRPEETLLRAGIQQANDRFDDEAFPRRAYFGMAFQRSRVGDAKQRVQQPAVPDVDLRPLTCRLPMFSCQLCSCRTMKVALSTSRYRWTVV